MIAMHFLIVVSVTKDDVQDDKPQSPEIAAEAETDIRMH